jgi:hypothetical protein
VGQNSLSQPRPVEPGYRTSGQGTVPGLYGEVRGEP